MGEDLEVFRAQCLRDARLAAGLTQVQLAAALGTTRHEVGRWERGEFVPRPQMIPAVAAVVGLDPLELLEVDPAAPRLEDLRMAAGLSLDAMSAKIPMVLTTYRDLELGTVQRDPPPATVKRIAAILAVPTVTVRQAIEEARDEYQELRPRPSRRDR